MVSRSWLKCKCQRGILFIGELTSNSMICPHCGYHFPLSVVERILLLGDESTFIETNGDMISRDPLNFTTKPYLATLDKAMEESGTSEAIVTGRARINGKEIMLGVMNHAFIGGSMGSVVGEKVTQAFETATEEGLSVVLSITSGGARMQEGMLSLMQMAKTASAVERHSQEGLAYIGILTDPSYGGVMASFGSLGDIIIAEPGARIGFAGSRVIEQTIRQKLPKGFQSSEFQREHGMIDDVIPRKKLKQTISLLLDYLAA